MTALGMRMRQDNPNDEYYTRYEDIEKTLMKIKDKFINKVIYMCCDNPNVSNFWKFFKNNYHIFRYKKIIATYYSDNTISIKTTYDGRWVEKTLMKTNGDMLNKECKEIMAECDIIITNPPFSKIKDLLNIIRDKEYILVAPFTVIQHLIPEMVNEELYCVGQCIKFISECKIKTINNGIWITNIKGEYLPKYNLKKKFEDIEHKYIDDTDYLDIDKCCDIPYDYNKEIAVPITLLKYLNYNQFQVIGILNHPYINKKAIFKRLIVKLKGYDDK